MIIAVSFLELIGGGMFDQTQDQNSQQQSEQLAAPQQHNPAQPVQQSPAAPPADHQFSAPKPAYESIFDDPGMSQGSLSSDDTAAPASGTPAAPVAAQDDANGSAPAAAPSPAVTDEANDLLDIKKQALQELSPLVGQLEQSPEEKFHTTMRIIQASDNHTLIKEAYAAAQQIPDEKIRAQALLDIVNEINYFTKEEDDDSVPTPQE